MRWIWLAAAIALSPGCDEKVPLGSLPAPTDAGAVVCAPSAAPSLEGKVLAPNGMDPVPDALVYVPRGEPAPVTPIGQCDPCRIVPDAWAQVHTDATGHFARRGLPTGELRVVLQLGQFRRVVSVNASCGAHLTLPPALARLPRNRSEGNVPRVAVTTGTVDTMQDVIAKIGLEEVDVYEGLSRATGGHPSMEALLTDPARLGSYNIVLINCHDDYEGLLASGPTVANLQSFVHAGGRLFVDDQSYEFVARAFPDVMTFEGSPSTPDAAEIGLKPTGTTLVEGLIGDDSLRTWLLQFPGVVGASGAVPIEGWLDDWAVVRAAGPSATTWVSGNVRFAGGPGIRPLSVGADRRGPDGQGCGRVVFNSYHTVAPKSSPTSPFLPQERILEFLFFQIGACLQIG